MNVNDLVRRLDTLDIGFEAGANGALVFTRTANKGLDPTVIASVPDAKVELLKVAAGRAFDCGVAHDMTLADLVDADVVVLVVRSTHGDVMRLKPRDLINTVGAKQAKTRSVLVDLGYTLIRVEGKASK